MHLWFSTVTYCWSWQADEMLPHLSLLSKNFAEVLRGLVWNRRWRLLQFFVVVFAVLGFELRAYILSHSTRHFWEGFFLDRVLQTICPGWLQTSVFLISASLVGRITDMSHWCLDAPVVFMEGC
jgi:hypothetical protein